MQLITTLVAESEQAVAGLALVERLITAGRDEVRGRPFARFCGLHGHDSHLSLLRIKRGRAFRQLCRRRVTQTQGSGGDPATLRTMKKGIQVPGERKLPATPTRKHVFVMRDGDVHPPITSGALFGKRGVMSRKLRLQFSGITLNSPLAHVR